MQNNVQPEPDEQAAARRSVDRAFPTVAAFLASTDAQQDAPVMRADALQVNPCPALDAQCLGEDCRHPREQWHRGTTHGLSLSFTDEPLLPFELAQWSGDAPRLAFFADGTWPDLDVAQVDELLLALDEYAGALRVARDHLAAAVRAERGGE